MEQHEETEPRRSTRARAASTQLTHESLGTNTTQQVKQCHQSVKNVKIEQQHNLTHNEADANECDIDEATVAAHVMSEVNCKCKSESQFAQQHLFEKGLKKFGKEGEAAGFKEAKQLHNRR